MPHAEIAEVLGKSEPACRMLLSRGLVTLSALMEQWTTNDRRQAVAAWPSASRLRAVTRDADALGRHGERIVQRRQRQLVLECHRQIRGVVAGEIALAHQSVDGVA